MSFCERTRDITEIGARAPLALHSHDQTRFRAARIGDQAAHYGQLDVRIGRVQSKVREQAPIRMGRRRTCPLQQPS